MAFTASTSVAQACNAVGALSQGIVDQLLGLSRRIAALQRAANLITQSAQDYVMPDISSLAPLQSSIDTYRAFQAACPNMPFPMANGVPDISSMINMLTGGFQGLLGGLNSSPLGMLSQLEGILGNLVSSNVSQLGPMKDMLNCLCSARNIDLPNWDEDKQKAIDTWNYISSTGDDAPSLADSNMKIKLEQFNDTRNTLQNIIITQQGELGSTTQSGQSNDNLSQIYRRTFSQ